MTLLPQSPEAGPDSVVEPIDSAAGAPVGSAVWEPLRYLVMIRPARIGGCSPVGARIGNEELLA
jgi:hypothetical protein